MNSEISFNVRRVWNEKYAPQKKVVKCFKNIHGNSTAFRADINPADLYYILTTDNGPAEFFCGQFASNIAQKITFS